MCPENSGVPVRNLPKLVTLTPSPHPKQASTSFSPKESITPKAKTFAFPESSGASFVQMPFLVVDNFLCPSVTVLCAVPVVPRIILSKAAKGGHYVNKRVFSRRLRIQ